MNIMSFNPDLNTQIQEVIFSRIRFSKVLGISLNEKLTFCYDNLVKNAQISARCRKFFLFYLILGNMVYYSNLFINFEI